MWSVAAIEVLFAPPFDDLLLRARKQMSRASRSQLGTAVRAPLYQVEVARSIARCPQAARYHTGVKSEQPQVA
jgi:hypothetical protein